MRGATQSAGGGGVRCGIGPHRTGEARAAGGGIRGTDGDRSAVGAIPTQRSERSEAPHGRGCGVALRPPPPAEPQRTKQSDGGGGRRRKGPFGAVATRTPRRGRGDGHHTGITPTAATAIAGRRGKRGSGVGVGATDGPLLVPITCGPPHTSWCRRGRRPGRRQATGRGPRATGR